jgi:four helix bundle protein
VDHEFDHEGLEVYRLALEVSHWLLGAEFPRGTAWIRDQAQRSIGSVVLNIAEGRSRRSEGARRNHYRIALGSAAEACAALDILPLQGAPANQTKLRRVGAMLARLSR